MQPSCATWIAHVIPEFRNTRIFINLLAWHFSIANLCSPQFMASEAEINQRLRSLHQDFDFLLDSNVISTELYDDLVQQIPRRNVPKRLCLMGQDTKRVQNGRLLQRSSHQPFLHPPLHL